MSNTPEHPSVPEQEGISLQELSEAFARVMGGQSDLPLAARPSPAAGEPRSEASAETADAGSSESPQPLAPLDSAGDLPSPGGEVAGGEVAGVEAAGDESGDDAPCRLSPRTILEAMLFVGNRQNEPLNARQASELMRGVAPEEIPSLIDDLNRRYRSCGCPYEVLAERGGFRMALREEFFPIRNRLYGRVREARLSQAAIDVLAIIAYRQPLTGEEVSRVRGKPSGHVLTQLVRRQLLRIERTDEKPHKTIYFTTARFLALFGLESLDDLPQSEELDKR